MNEKNDKSPLQFHGILSGFVVFVVAMALLGGGYFANVIRKDQHEASQQIQLLNKNILQQSQQAVILKIVDANLKNSTIDEKVKLAQVIYNMCFVKNIPPSLVCAVFEHESRWDPKEINTESGARGLGQLIPRYTYAYLRAGGYEESEDILLDPVVNATVSIAQLADHQKDHVKQKRTKPTDFLLALHTYAWGKAATLKLFGKKDQRVDIPNMAYPSQIIELQSKYKSLGLE